MEDDSVRVIECVVTLQTMYEGLLTDVVWKDAFLRTVPSLPLSLFLNYVFFYEINEPLSC